MGFKLLDGLNPREYEHPLDKKTLDALEKTAGLDALVRKFYDLGFERVFRLELTGSSLKVTSSSFPDLHEVLEETCEILNLKKIPEFYIHTDTALEGITIGVDKPIVLISTDAVEYLSLDELRFIIGREVGHIKSQHVLYKEIGYLLPVLSNILSSATLGLGSLITAGLRIALINWERAAGYTADRAGLLACQDVTTATLALAKVAGLPKKYFDSFNIDDFVTQAREFEGFNEIMADKILRNVSLAFRERAWTIMRANEFFKWTESGAYSKILERETRISSPSLPSVNFCPQCGFKLESVAKFCSQCGENIIS